MIGIRDLAAADPSPTMLEHVRSVIGADSTAPCTVADMRLVPGERSHVLFDVAGRQVVGTLVDDSAPLELRPIESDTALRGLAVIHDQAALTALVNEWLPGPAAVRCSAELLRYRPGRRATFMIEKTTEVDNKLVQRHFVAKLYHDHSKAESVFHAMNALHEHAQAPDLVVAQPVAIDHDSWIVGQHMVTGQPLWPMLVAGTDRATTAISQSAVALAAVHDLPLVSKRSRSVEKTVGKLVRRAGALAQLIPVVCDPLVALTERLATHLDRAGTPDAFHHVLHGDAKADQFLLRDDGVALLDFDHVGVGDPALDVADFTAKLRQRSLASGEPDLATTAHFERTFLSAYEQATNAGPDIVGRVAFCAAVSTARRALRSYQRAPHAEFGPLLVAECNDQLNRLGDQGEAK